MKVRVEIRDPNPPAVTARLLVQALMEVNWTKVEQALREAKRRLEASANHLMLLYSSKEEQS